MKTLLISLLLLFYSSHAFSQIIGKDTSIKKVNVEDFIAALKAESIILHTIPPITFEYTNEEKLYNKLKSYHVDSTISSVHFMEFNNKINVSKRVKQLLVRLLKNEWTNEERENYIASRQKREYASFYKEKTEGIDKLIADLNYDTAMMIVNKSVQEKFVQKINNEINNRDVAPMIIKTVAWLDMKEMAPFLKVTLLSNTNQYNREAVGLALARLGDTAYDYYFSNYENQLIGQNENMKSGNWRSIYEQSIEQLAFIATQNSIFHIHVWMDTTKKTSLVSDGSYKCFTAALFIEKIRRLIKNADFRKIAEKLYQTSPNANTDIEVLSGVKPELIIEICNWLVANKGRYIINREVYSGQPNQYFVYSCQ